MRHATPHPGKQLQDIDIICAEGGGPRRVKPLLTERRAKPHAARISSKSECHRGDGWRREERLPIPAGEEFHQPRDVRAGCRGEADVVRQGRDHHGQIDKPQEENAAGRTTLHAKESTPISDSSSRLVHFCRVRHAGRQARSHTSLYGGKRIS